jgi:hypothetical protein
MAKHPERWAPGTRNWAQNEQVALNLMRDEGQIEAEETIIFPIFLVI